MAHRKILLPIDGTETIERSTSYGVSVVRQNPGAKLIILALFRPVLKRNYCFWGRHITGDFEAWLKEEQESRYREYLERVTDRLRGQGIDVEYDVCYYRTPDTLLKYATANQVDLVILKLPADSLSAH
jgi:nucleotide-binding universal stress UspA family protein